MGVGACYAKIGPPKDLARAMAKAVNSGSLTKLFDFNRCKVVSKDPFVLAIIFAYLRKTYRVIGLRNYYTDKTPKDYMRYVQMTLEIDGHGYAAEVFLYLEQFYEIEDATHLPYELL